MGGISCCNSLFHKSQLWTPTPAHVDHATVGGRTTGYSEMDYSFWPDTAQLSQLISQATAPAFIMGAVAGFVSILMGRMTAVVERIRHLNEIPDDEQSRAERCNTFPPTRFSKEAEISASAAEYSRRLN
jgi:hypothetical protein